MNNVKMLRSKQFRSLFNKQLIKYELGIDGLYAAFNLKKKYVKIFRMKGIIFTVVNEVHVWSQKDLEDIWNNKDLV